LSKRFVDSNFEFAKTLSGVKQLRPRWRRGIDQVDGRLGELLGQTYVERYFAPSSKTMMEQLVANLKKAAAVRIKGNSWMSAVTKQAALTKLDKMEVMVGYLSATPSAAFALSAHRAWAGAPCPIVSTPYLSYQREFLGFGMFNQGPANALFRTGTFNHLGGFVDLGPHSDLAFWLRVCRSVNVLLIPADLYWYRVHEGQHLRTLQAAFDQARAAGFYWEALNHPECPLRGAELATARRNVAFAAAKLALRAMKAGRLQLAGAYLRHSGLSAREWARYLRPPRRAAEAGAPQPAS